MPSRTDLLIIGGGRMGAALVSGLLGSGKASGVIAIVEKDESRRSELVDLLPGTYVMESIGEGLSARAAILAVKPAQAEEACAIAKAATSCRVLSIMAGVPIRALETWLGAGPAVLRAMPNTPALVGAGVTALAGGSSAMKEDLEWGLGILNAVGEVVAVDESLLDAVTGLSGSGPAYVFLATEALVKAGVAAGLPAEVSRVLARQTVVGAAKLLAESDQEPEFLRAQVTSPGGTTEAGIAALEAHGFEEALRVAVAAAADRAAEMGQELTARLQEPPQA
ncbi:MAG: pyrroline-5-carboxylate reductase [Acidimicrobiales bacterium]